MSTSSTELRHLAERASTLAAELHVLAARLEQETQAPLEAPARGLDVSAPGVHEGRIWFNTAQAADVAGRHRATVVKACEAGELHGTQRKKNGRWRIHVDCLNAWCAGQECEHHQES